MITDYFSRFGKDEIIRTNLQRIVPPRQYLVVGNIPIGKSPQELANLFAETGLNVTDMIGYRSVPTRKQQVFIKSLFMFLSISQSLTSVLSLKF